MRATERLIASLALAGILILSGCNRQTATSETAVAPEAAAPAEAPAGGGSTAKRAAPSSTAPSAPRTIATPVAPPAAPPKPIVIAEGTPIVVRTTDALSTKTHQSGQTFVAHLDEPLIADGREVAPRGSQVEGRVVTSDDGGRVKGVASIAVQLTSVQAGGRTIDISTSSVSRAANTTKKKDAVKVGIGSGIGAAIGAIAGGGKGAAIGAATGAGAGTGVVLATKGDPAVIPSESVLSFTLSAPVSVTR